MPSQTYQDNVITSSGVVAYSSLASKTYADNNLATAKSYTDSSIAAIPSPASDRQVSTSLYSAAVSGSPTNITSANITLGPTITTINSVSMKDCVIYIPVALTPTSGNTMAFFNITLTGSNLTSVLSAGFDSLKTVNTSVTPNSNDIVVMRDVSFAGSMVFSCQFGPNTSGSHSGVIRIVAIHA